MNIVKTEDPAVTELRRIVENELPIGCSFLYANLYEANFGLDGTDEKFPLFLFVSNDKSKNEIQETGEIYREVNVVGMMLNAREVGEPTSEFSSEELSPAIDEMRQLADALIYAVNNSSLTSPTLTVDQYDIEKVYAKFDRHLFGVGINFKWTIQTGVRGC